VADLFICKSNGLQHGLFIEVKYGKNKQSETQLEFERVVKKHGYEYKLVYSLDQLMEVLKTYESPIQVKTYQDGYIDGMLNAQITKI
jgi:glutamate synthase domain-containing protein 1